jgi:hypothetical protein
MRALRNAFHDIGSINQSMLRSEIESIFAQPRHRDPKCLIPFGAKVYSQCDEDGILAEIFRRIGTTNKTFVEFGIGNGLENNTLALLFDQWKGLWIEASDESVKKIKTNFAPVIHSGRLKIVESFITKDNIDRLISDNIPQREIDLLSVDIDGNDYYVLNAINSISPRVIVMEYNAKMRPPIWFCMDYNDSHAFGANDCYGASLTFLESKLRERGYLLVGCNLSGANAFFVRSELVGDSFLEPYTAEHHYQPARFHLACIVSGERPSYDALAKSLQCHAMRS